MDYVYAALWLLVALLLIFKFTKENKFFYFLGGFFVVMAAWFLANPLIPDIDLFSGTYGLVFRVVAAVVLVVTGVFYYKNFTDKGEKK